MTPDEIRTSLSTTGYVILPSLVPPALLPTLRAAALSTTSLARSGAWPHIRTVGKQFPPWPTSGPDIWGVSHILHPSLPASAIFREWYSSPPVLDAVSAILGCGESELCLQLCGLLVNPVREEFELSWHRDGVPAGAEEEEEGAALGLGCSGGEGGTGESRWESTQWNTALYSDACLRVVPGSHRRVRTPAERAVTLEGGEMPGEVAVHLKAGETVFYDNNILHRGVYGTAPERATLHASMGVGGRMGEVRRREVLQHGLEWVGGVVWEGKMEELRRRLVEGEGERWGVGGVGFSLEG
ncbi:phytanoyl-CoA dioxygenase [Geopyxis carbonaria]|nr:phytanoyl-CoA dioxygenase [Geopyxis carbonaria]